MLIGEAPGQIWRPHNVHLQAGPGQKMRYQVAESKTLRPSQLQMVETVDYLIAR